MKPAPFSYARPASIEDVLAILAEHDGAKILAGGQSLMPMMNFRMAQPDVLVDVNRIPGLSGIEVEADWLTIGAMVRHVDVKDSPAVASACPLIVQAYDHVAHETIRNRGTIGGNLAHADPASELPAVMLVVDSVLVARSLRGERRIAAEDFFVTALTPDLEQDELLVSIRVPVQPPARGFAIDEFALRKGDLALAGVVAALDRADGRCVGARIALFGVSDRAVRVEEAEGLLIGGTCASSEIAAAADAAVGTIEFEAGPGITADYRRSLTHTLICRTVARAWERCA